MCISRTQEAKDVKGIWKIIKHVRSVGRRRFNKLTKVSTSKPCANPCQHSDSHIGHVGRFFCHRSQTYQTLWQAATFYQNETLKEGFGRWSHLKLWPLRAWTSLGPGNPFHLNELIAWHQTVAWGCHTGCVTPRCARRVPLAPSSNPP